MAQRTHPAPADPDGRIFDRVMARVEGISGGCLVWTGEVNEKGYGVTKVRGKHYFVHRLCYLLRGGPIPMGLVLDHLCRNRRCVNIDHLACDHR